MEIDTKPDITQCLELYQQLLEKKEGWGPINAWRFSQFRDLSSELKEATGVSVSYITLTRILQSKEFKRSPQVTTLNALASYLDFEDWDAFCNHCLLQNAESDSQAPSSTPREKPLVHWLRKRGLAVGGIAIVIALAMAYSLLSSRNNPIQNADIHGVSLELIGQKSKVPGRLILKYKVPAEGYFFGIVSASFSLDTTLLLSENVKELESLQLNDSIIILNKQKKLLPGPYQGIIFKENKIVKCIHFNFETEGWISTIIPIVSQRHRSPFFPIFLPPLRNEAGNLTIPEQLQEDIRGNYMEKRYKVNFFLAKDFGVDANQMRFETRIKVAEPYNALGCKHVVIGLLSTHNMIEIPIVQSLCSSILKLWASEVVIANNDRSEEKRFAQYHRDTLDWEHLAIETQDNVVRVYWNEQLIDQIEYTEPLGQLGGIRIRFDGIGALDFVKVEDAEGNIVYEDEFMQGGT